MLRKKGGREGGKKGSRKKKEAALCMDVEGPQERISSALQKPTCGVIANGHETRGSIRVRLHIYRISLHAKQKNQLTVAAPTQGCAFGWRGGREKSGSFDHC